eukprot:Plantae.Rhodophyta-Purpureofilum_apyrenoidigerum.ctg28751.p1 GENE.Plantae.Rhodophyta-Purpureofilum_apyrenoidigerum.ctg28751~~Plantae.Rhodophyta-Purpureofilum_apyrenoidigerum.ctg28751.p1  ORF type:complete len:236 (-),score=53.11 Plantae.Rhodophyta-Purpureofilum_apyrenoidigerum.ctg28751:150-857(-)
MEGSAMGFVGQAFVVSRHRCSVTCELRLKGIVKPMAATGALKEIVGDRLLSRAEFLKVLSDYAKEKGLKEPGNRIRCDMKLKKMFDNEESIALFDANKFFSKLTISPEDAGPAFVKRAEEYEEQYFARKASETTKSKKKDTKPATKPATKAKKSSAATGLLRPVKLSKELAAICGGNEMPRPQITKALWDYAKKNDLKRGRTIICDEKLKKVIGLDEVDGFKMVSYLKPHISNIE